MWRTWMKEAVSNGLNMVQVRCNIRESELSTALQESNCSPSCIRFLMQVYIFWNFHEQVEGVYNFNDRGNLTDFMQAAAEAGLFVNLR